MMLAAGHRQGWRGALTNAAPMAHVRRPSELASATSQSKTGGSGPAPRLPSRSTSRKHHDHKRARDRGLNAFSRDLGSYGGAEVESGGESTSLDGALCQEDRVSRRAAHIRPTAHPSY
jgi:hypothetical protein